MYSVLDDIVCMYMSSDISLVTLICSSSACMYANVFADCCINQLLREMIFCHSIIDCS